MNGTDNHTPAYRRCRWCGAANGLTLRVPPLAGRYWECADGCPTPGDDDTAGSDLRQRFAAELHRIADDIVRLKLPLGRYPSLRLGVVDTRTDLETWADYLGTDGLDADDSTGIPSVTAGIRLGDGLCGPELTIAAQSPKDEMSEVERLRARVAELEAQQAEGGEGR